MRSGVALVFAVVGLAACGGGGEDGYPQESIDAFVKECAAEPKSAERQCRCVVERLQETMPYEEFARADEALTENREPAAASLEKLRAAVTACGTA
ncbi:MAG: hypothetical protein ABI717_08795 [Actinomycetota bacterium]